MVPAKFRQCRRPHQNQSPRSRRHRTRCHRPGRLQITMCASSLSRQLLLNKITSNEVNCFVDLDRLWELAIGLQIPGLVSRVLQDDVSLSVLELRISKGAQRQ